MAKKGLNKKFLVVIPVVILLAVVIYNLFLKKKTFYYAGTIEATKVDISAQVPSTISDFKVNEGTLVKRGDLLVELACQDIRNAYELSQKDFSRAQKLFKVGAITQENYDHILNKRNEIQIKRDWCVITSNIDGKVLTTFHEAGEYVVPGMKLLTLADLSEVWAMIYVPQKIQARLKTGVNVAAVIPELDLRQINGEVSYISDIAEFTPKNVQTREERTRLIYGVKVKFKNQDDILKPGMSIEVNLEDYDN